MFVFWLFLSAAIHTLRPSIQRHIPHTVLVPVTGFGFGWFGSECTDDGFACHPSRHLIFRKEVPKSGQCSHAETAHSQSHTLRANATFLLHTLETLPRCGAQTLTRTFVAITNWTIRYETLVDKTLERHVCPLDRYETGVDLTDRG